MVDFEDCAAQRLLRVLSANRIQARHIEQQLGDIALAAERMGQTILAKELNYIGAAVVDMSVDAYHAHGELIREEGHETANNISRVIATALGGKA